MNIRRDLLNIANLIEDNNKLLELGCGDGDLLDFLSLNKNIDGRGIEIEQERASDCVQKGLSVIQGNINTDLAFYPDNCFDYVISSQVLQATQHPQDVLQQIMRIGKQAIISTPNFGYWYNRFYLLLKGRMPVSKTLSYEWYETPNIHFSTMRDFENLCLDMGYKIKQKVYLAPTGHRLSPFSTAISPNLMCEKCIFVLETA